MAPARRRRKSGRHFPGYYLQVYVTIGGYVMVGQVVLLHGWSASSDSFKPLRVFLQALGCQTTDIWLGDYISLDDDMRVEDVAKRMRSVIAERLASGRNIRYFGNRKDGASGHVVVHAQDLDDRENLPARFHRNSTHLIELILPREPIADVFTLKR